jgi:hypothetical protein
MKILWTRQKLALMLAFMGLGMIRFMACPAGCALLPLIYVQAHFPAKHF